MTHGLRMHRSPLPESALQGLRTAGILILTLLIFGILFAGISLIQQTNSLLTPP